MTTRSSYRPTRGRSDHEMDAMLLSVVGIPGILLVNGWAIAAQFMIGEDLWARLVFGLFALVCTLVFWYMIRIWDRDAEYYAEKDARYANCRY